MIHYFPDACSMAVGTSQHVSNVCVSKHIMFVFIVHVIPSQACMHTYIGVQDLK